MSLTASEEKVEKDDLNKLYQDFAEAVKEGDISDGVASMAEGTDPLVFILGMLSVGVKVFEYMGFSPIDARMAFLRYAESNAKFAAAISLALVYISMRGVNYSEKAKSKTSVAGKALMTAIERTINSASADLGYTFTLGRKATGVKEVSLSRLANMFGPELIKSMMDKKIAGVGARHGFALIESPQALSVIDRRNVKAHIRYLVMFKEAVKDRTPINEQLIVDIYNADVYKGVRAKYGFVGERRTITIADVREAMAMSLEEYDKRVERAKEVFIQASFAMYRASMEVSSKTLSTMPSLAMPAPHSGARTESRLDSMAPTSEMSAFDVDGDLRDSDFSDNE